ncbi:predicted protein [Aspergillus nidulans FGSC A4]|uniref:Uncharacterized protein n=1 Tax=Emericella nidulans (strain FGSC A4 / ATCC 38163 / CBS 112.46 / NRRL 194 / M139) TaxID=227321 RepID=Q5AXI6_EMENI|nr:hypothetical protein [Aspergillus nidulans FGSC A4]EAA61640.1 predicted protein [Aspergillus nidulans FGSC A4]CBF79296.1 TPA: hypothetical protein ANIA_06994 [Aspergillus nidulans FGSC A4]|eukprot:XP_664598.1 predicted protein [Aspergillus nidulans FGSC A4]
MVAAQSSASVETLLEFCTESARPDLIDFKPSLVFVFSFLWPEDVTIGLQENAFPTANVDVISAVFGKTNENQPIVKIIRPGPMADRCAKLAMKKKNIARLRVLSVPYCEILIKIVPKETTDAGTNNDSVGCKRDALKVYGNK